MEPHKTKADFQGAREESLNRQSYSLSWTQWEAYKKSVVILTIGMDK